MQESCFCRQINLMGEFFVGLISSLETEGYLGPILIFLTGLFSEKANSFKPLTFVLKIPPS